MPEKYGRNDSFNDPVVRCAGPNCGKLIMRGVISKTGSCPNCGSKRMSEVMALDSEKEVPELLEKGVDPEWIALFEAVDPEIAEGVINAD